MGLADFFKGRGKKKDTDLEDKQEEPRCAYIFFPHIALRQFVFASPYLCMGALGTPEGKGVLREILESVAALCQQQGDEATLTSEQIHVHKCRVKKKHCLVFEMPEPRAATEVYFVGIVLSPPLGDTAADLTGVKIRYFTLEKGPHGHGSPLTVLCEWPWDDKQYNYGEGPAPDLKKFVQAISDKCGDE